ncbi:hypothetical protein [Nitratidesulfovibrio liaohensis]|uniref:Uncharacterized protein n=1 Tax=Nitratidesulfovibrio liaohensis TaxID=2604158 RepID=A0ABY9QYW0_9BACT|nr:hypothetical protein [Nitratidesulfovibrio liaohensis]WMW64369.1 hypothetical protein KPS_002381 [Nitratidesulfovibrio liaohensis]
MGTKTIIFCDLCPAEKGVKTYSVEYGWRSCPAGGSSEDVSARADLCPKCKESLDWEASSVSDVAGVGAKEERRKIALAALYQAASSGLFRRATKAERSE